MSDRAQPALKLGDQLQLNLIELPKADCLGAGNPALAAWIAFLEHWHEEHTMAQLDYPPVQQALEHIKHLSASSTRKRWMRFLLNSDTVFGAIVPHSLAPNSLP